MDRPLDPFFARELRERFPHLRVEWMQLGWFGSTVVEERYVVWEVDRRGNRVAYMVVQSPEFQFREPGRWLLDVFQKESFSRFWNEKHAMLKWKESLASKDKVDAAKAKQAEASRERWTKGDIREKAMFATGNKRSYQAAKVKEA